MKKKILAIFLVVAMVAALAVGLTACKKDDGKKDTKVTSFEPIAKENIKFGLITLHGEESTYDKNFIDAARKAIKNAGLSDNQLIIKTGVPEGDECYDAAAELVGKGCNIIFADSFGHEPYVLKAAKEFPNVRFCHATGTTAHTELQPNFYNAFASIYEGRYLAGMDEFTTGSMSTTATGDGNVTIDISITSTNKSTAEPKTGRWQTSYNMLYQKVEVEQTTIRLNGLATFQDTTHYAWLGPDQTALRQGESTLRLKNGRIERTPISAEGGMTSSNFADVSTVVPYNIINELTYSASTQNDGLIIFSTVLGETDSAQRTLYLGDPSECQGKILYVKNVVGNNTKVQMSSNVYRQDLLIPCNSASEVTEISIGANSSMFMSNGLDWIQFNCA